jgi:hypothetical protein
MVRVLLAKDLEQAEEWEEVVDEWAVIVLALAREATVYAQIVGSRLLTNRVSSVMVLTVHNVDPI